MFLNNSRASTYLRCPRRYFLEIVRGIIPSREDLALRYGTAWHAAMAVYYRALSDGRLNASDCMKAFHDSFGPFDELALEEQEVREAYEMGIRTVCEYFKRKTALDNFQVLQVETEFVVPLGEVCYCCGYSHNPFDNCADYLACARCGAEVHHLVGRVDLSQSQEGFIGITDHKTAKNMGDDYMSQFQRHMGMIGYAYGYAKALNTKIMSYTINVSKKLKTIGTDRAEWKCCPSCKNGKKKKLTCLECKGEGRVKKERPLEAFFRESFKLAPSDVDRMVLNRLQIAGRIQDEELLYRNNPTAAWPMNDQHCRWCPLQSHCWESPALRWFEHSPDPDKYTIRPADYVDNLANMSREETQ